MDVGWENRHESCKQPISRDPLSSGHKEKQSQYRFDHSTKGYQFGVIRQVGRHQTEVSIALHEVANAANDK